MTIKELRKQTKLSQANFAYKYKLPLSTLSSWEQGKKKAPEHIMKYLEICIVEGDEKKAEKYVSGLIKKCEIEKI